MNKKIIIATIIVLLLLTSVGCVSDYQKSIYDNDDLIIKQGDTFSYRKRVMSQLNDDISMSFSAFYGKDTLYDIKVSEQSVLTIELELKVESGLLKLCLVLEDDTIIVIASNSYKDTLTYNIPSERNRLILVGNEAKGSINIKASTKAA